MRKVNAALLLLALGALARAGAQGLQVDQSLQIPAFVPGETYHYDSSEAAVLSGTGQEFTPSMSGLDFVSLNLFSPISSAGSFQVAIHAGTITAPILALSDTVSSPAGGFANNTALFTFASIVPLTPGDTYVFELDKLSSGGSWSIEIPSSAVVNGNTINMNYPGGRLIYNGAPQGTEDMIFSEGLIVPEPGATQLGLLGLLVFGIVKRKSIFGNIAS